MNAARRGLVEMRCRSRAMSLRLGDLCAEDDFAGLCGLRACLLGTGSALYPFGGDVMWVKCLSSAELFLVEGVELPESDATLRRRELIGIRD